MRILTTDWHIPYIFLLAYTGHEFHVVGSWNKMQRPQPPNVAVISEKEAIHSLQNQGYDLIIGHHPMHDPIRFGFYGLSKGVPYVQVLHGRLERTGYKRSSVKRVLKWLYKSVVLAPISRWKFMHSVFISLTVQKSWRLRGTVITPGVPIEEMVPWSGHLKTLLVVGNNLHREHFDYIALLELAKRLPLKILGENPKIPIAKPATNWDDLKRHYSECRAFVNLTTEPEDGYNLATLEAMAAGMPILTLAHPTSPIRDGYNGLAGEDLEELLMKGKLLLSDCALAHDLGSRARETVREAFSMARFIQRWNECLESVLKH